MALGAVGRLETSRHTLEGFCLMMGVIASNNEGWTSFQAMLDFMFRGKFIARFTISISLKVGRRPAFFFN